MKLTARPIAAKYKKMGKHIVVESGYSHKLVRGKLVRVPAYRIVGTMTGR